MHHNRIIVLLWFLSDIFFMRMKRDGSLNLWMCEIEFCERMGTHYLMRDLTQEEASHMREAPRFFVDVGLVEALRGASRKLLLQYLIQYLLIVNLVIARMLLFFHPVSPENPVTPSLLSLSEARRHLPNVLAV